MRLRACARTAVSLLGALLAAGTLLAQPAADSPPPVEVSGGGTEVFRGLLDRAGIKPITERELTASLGLRRFDDVILISLGDPNAQGFRRAGLEPLKYLQQVSAQGSVLIAADSFLGVQSSAQQQMAVSGDLVECRDEQASHRGKSKCPYVVPANSRGNRETLQLFK